MNLKDLRRVAIVALLATSLTHPFVWVLATGWTRIFAAEIGAALVESICYVIAAGASVRVGLTIGVTTNVASACFGFVLLLALKHHP